MKHPVEKYSKEPGRMAGNCISAGLTVSGNGFLPYAEYRKMLPDG